MDEPGIRMVPGSSFMVIEYLWTQSALDRFPKARVEFWLNNLKKREP
jgi:hypothetical protein